MTDLSRLGEQLRNELGQPPADWTQRQSARLRDLDLRPDNNRWRPLGLAAIILSGFLAFGVYHAVKPSGDENLSALPVQGAASRAVWLHAESTPTTHRFADFSSIQLEVGASGRLDEGLASGARFDLHEGKASFAIEKQKGSEFSVLAGEYRVVVVGTRFTVRYAPPQKLTVWVEEGAVNVVLPERPQPVLVGAGEQLEASGAEFSLSGQTDASSDFGATSGDDLSQTAHSQSTSEGGTKQGPLEQSSASAEPPSSSWHKLYAAGKYEAACGALGRETLVVLQKQLSAADLIDLSSALRLCGKTSDALRALETLRQRFAGSAQAKDALFLMGRIHATGGSPDLAVTYLKQYVQDGDGDRFSPEALGRLIEIHVARGQRMEAQKYAQRYLATAPQGPYQRLAESVVEKR